MISVRLDPTSLHNVRWPQTLEELIELAQKYITRQDSLPTNASKTCLWPPSRPSWRKPATRAEIITFLGNYLAYEISLDVAQQITDPALTAVDEMLSELENALGNRTTGRDQRELG